MIEQKAGLQSAVAGKVVPRLTVAGVAAAYRDILRHDRHLQLSTIKGVTGGSAQRFGHQQVLRQHAEEPCGHQQRGDDVIVVVSAETERGDQDADGTPEVTQLEGAITTVMGLEELVPEVFGESIFEGDGFGHGWNINI